MIDRLARWVSIPSLSRQEGALADAICAELQQAGLSVSRLGNNLWCTIGDAPRPRLLLNSHLDTVPPGQGWSHDPWTPRLADGRLVGLGANDAKGCGVAMLAAVLAIRRQVVEGQRLGGTIVFALTAEEEISGHGLETVLEQLRPLDAAIVGEPTGLAPVTAQRGLLILCGVARGRSAHPANTPPDSSDNAILTAARDLARLSEFDWGPAHPLLGRCHAHVTMIRGGTALNVIPDECTFHLDIRTTPLESHGALHARLSQSLRSPLHVHSARLVPMETDAAEPIVQAALRARPGSVPRGSAAMSDMVFLTGVPTVKIGPGETIRSHTPDEFLYTHELEQGAETYRAIIAEYFATWRAASAVAARAEQRA